MKTSNVWAVGQIEVPRSVVLLITHVILRIRFYCQKNFMVDGFLPHLGVDIVSRLLSSPLATGFPVLSLFFACSTLIPRVKHPLIRRR